ncbi:transketolase, C-terminal subunit [Candidatus Gastranaerophilus sp. (ex Termes propinquus)]|nr:transketolase, C-terminal subunit [Candidatus Gastranaerophilus sp. (ex Termes propinquus)]
MFKCTDEIKSPRTAYGNTLVDIGAKNKDIVVLDADLSCSTQTCMFAKAYPDRFFNVGIAEQDLMGTAAGLATVGKTPFVSTFAMFATARCLDQIRNSICYSNLNVKIVATHGGVTVGEDGASHQALEDVAYMRAIPDMTVIVPADYTEVEQVIKYAANTYGPMYIRISRTNLKTIFDEKTYNFSPDKAVKIQEGADVTIVTNGETLIEVIDCAQMLKNVGIEADVLHIPVIKPFGAQKDVISSALKTKKVVTVENHSIIGGLGSLVCETLSEHCPTQTLRIGTNDVFGQSGEQRALMEHYGLTGEKLFGRVMQFLGKTK